MRNIAFSFFTAAVTLMGSCIVASVHAQSGSGWVSLFDGKTLNGWKQVTGKATYTVENGMIVGTSAVEPYNSFLVTEKEYGDFVLELDVKLESNASNSGVQTRSHFDPNSRNGIGTVYGRQVEIDPSDRRWTGGIEDEARRDWLYTMTLNPKAQPAYKQGDWNHLKIECIGNTTKTWVNGIAAACVVDTIDDKGFIGLQVHSVDANKAANAGKKFYFKNIRIKTTNLKPEPLPPGVFVVNYIPNSLSDYEQKDGWRLLFDGKTNAGWIGAGISTFPTKPNGWVVRDGTMTILGAGGGEAANVGDIVTTGQFSAFDLSFEFKMSRGANSGVKYFVTLKENTGGSAIGLEYQVLDDDVHPDAKLGRNGDRTLASLYDLIPANKPPRFIRPIGAWNTGRIVVYPNNHVVHYLNGIKVLEYDRGSKEYKDLVAISKYVVWKNFGEADKGHILLQDHGFEVSFRSIKIKPLQ